ncbi:glycine--tRNA ligase subunit beta [Pseudoxanthomonas sp. CAU 1598]|uniref:Glycine--tRNA ligase beta subunit n=2 Tax=Pseudomarimonas arenosa TaxID=2774145 RepID=A0AAW3ZM28_9GAMM|nr:glycine--tRNA ligase subunit beta [Pseudomarimonas arenosa]
MGSGLSLAPRAEDGTPKPTSKEGLLDKALLVELGTEELPVKALPGLAQAFVDGIVAGLERRGFKHGEPRVLYSPRRLAALISGVSPRQPEQKTERRGPAISQAFDADGEPSKAVVGFAASCGVTIDKLERLHTDKGAWFVFRSVTPGAALDALIGDIVNEAIAAMPIPKPMRWGNREVGFARPVHWLLMMHGERILNGQALGIKADRMTRGHRFMAPKPIWVARAEDYVDVLRDAKVLVDPDERRQQVRSEVTRATQLLAGRAHIDAGILEEVNCLNEWPVAVLCSFESRFLRVPQEALILTMEANQKFFPVLDRHDKLDSHFIGIANVQSRDEVEIRKGYERVIRPRFADAEFFFDEDCKQGIEAMNEGLAQVTYQQKLGSYADKVGRVAALAESLAPALGVDPAEARRAAELSKADLQSRMVGEFPELQGVMGRHYALAAGLSEAIASALDEQYQPRFAGDAIAESALGRLLAMAERIDTLAGGFAAGLKPTGNKDPFALRRAALALARTQIEGEIEFDLAAVLHQAVQQLPTDPGEVEAAEILDFVFDRLRSYYAEQDIPAQHFEAVLAVRPTSLHDFQLRIEAIASFSRLEDAGALAAANKRIRNILKKQADEPVGAVDIKAFHEDAERALFAALVGAESDNREKLESRDYVAALRRLARLRPEVDAFFDAVMVMVDDEALRRNRLALLSRLSANFLAVADISLLSTT